MAEFLAASGSRKISVLASVSELSGSTSMPVVMGGNTVQISHSSFLTNNLLTKSNIFSGNNTFNGQTTIQTGSVTGNLVVNGRINAPSFTGSLNFNNITDIPTLVSSSVQIISLLPNGTVSGSSQIIFSGISSIPNNIVSSSSQIVSLLPIDIVSGSSQIVDLLPTDIVSGSSQITALGFITSSQAIDTSAFATTGSNIFTDNQEIVSGGFVTELLAGLINIYATTGNEDTFEVVVQDGNGVRFFDWDGATMQPFLKTDTLSGPITLFRDTTITGSVEITGSLETTQTISTQILLTPQILIGQLIVPSGFNGMLTGPVSNGGELTIENGSNLVII